MQHAIDLAPLVYLSNKMGITISLRSFPDALADHRNKDSESVDVYHGKGTAGGRSRVGEDQHMKDGRHVAFPEEDSRPHHKDPSCNGNAQRKVDVSDGEADLETHPQLVDKRALSERLSPELDSRGNCSGADRQDIGEDSVCVKREHPGGLQSNRCAEPKEGLVEHDSDCIQDDDEKHGSNAMVSLFKSLPQFASFLFGTAPRDLTRRWARSYRVRCYLC